MSFLRKIYRQNIYGIMGTLVFHILVVLAFILADVDMKGSVKEEESLIEFPDDLPELQELQEQLQEVENQENPESSETKSINRTNAASNRLASQNITTSSEEFFDDEYLKEIEAAKQLVTDVNSQIAKEIIDIGDIKMPVETTEGMERDSIKNIVYIGESNIVYYLENRYHVGLPNPLYLAQGGGKIVVDIVVNQEGKVVQAAPRRNQKIKDEQVFLYARAAALGTVFNADQSAPPSQKGTIHYTFIAQ